MVSENENHKKLNSFFKEEYHSLKAYARSRIDDTADRDAEDIVQDVALKIFSRADSSSPINNIGGFVYSAIKNKIIDIMRIKKKEVSIGNEEETLLMAFMEQFYGESDNSYSEKMKSELKKAIKNLKPHYQHIIIAIDLEGFTYKDLSQETGIPKGTLMSRRHRALSILFKELETKKEINN